MATPKSMRWTSTEVEVSAEPSDEKTSKSGVKNSSLSTGTSAGREKRRKLEVDPESPATPIISRSVVASRARCGPEITLGEWLSSQSKG